MPTKKHSDGRWRYRFAFDGRRYSGSAPKGNNTKLIAGKLEKKHIEKLEANTYTGKMPTVAEFGARFLEFQKARTKPLTQVQQNATIHQHLIPKHGRKRLDEFDKNKIDDLVTAWATNSKPKTINTRLGTIRRMLSLAVEWNFLARIPKVQFLREDDDTPRFLTDAEARSLVEKAEPQWQSMMIVALRTGLRVGELRGLQWGDIDFARRVLEVKRTDPGRRTMEATSPKGKRSRTVPLTNDAIEALRGIDADRRKSNDWIWPALLKRAKETRSRARSEKGAWAAITRAAKKAKLTDVGWHTLRHTYASALVMRGVPIRHIQKWLGHASVKETEKYSHLSPDAGHDAVNALDVPLAPDQLRQTATKSLPEGDRERNNSGALPLKG